MTKQKAFKILVVEDDKEILEMEKSELERLEYRVFTASSAGEARRLLSNDRFDVILLDLKLGNESGRDVLAFIRRDKSMNAATPVVLVSGELDPRVIKEMSESIDGVLVKPFRYADLFKKLDDILQKPKAAVKKPKAKFSNKKSNVLIVDDDRSYGETLCEFLREQSVNAIYSPSAADAIKKMENQKFDCILLDYNLEETNRNGDWLLEQIRKDIGQMNFKTPVVMITGAVSQDSANLKNRIQGFLSKPVSNVDITKVVNHFVAKAA